MNTIQGYGIPSFQCNNKNISFGATMSRNTILQLLSAKPKDDAYIIKVQRRLQEIDVKVKVEGFIKLPSGSYVKLSSGKDSTSAHLSVSNNKSYIDLMEYLLSKNERGSTQLEELAFMSFDIGY